MTGFYNSADHLALLPAMMLALFGCALLLLRFVSKAPATLMRNAPAYIALAGLVFTGIALTRQSRWMAQTGSPELAGFHGALTVDSFALYFNWLFIGASALVILCSKDKRPEYFAILLFSQCGMFFLAAGADLVTIFLGLELMAISFYVLVAFGHGDRRSIEAAIKFLLLGGFSSAILAYGFSLLFGLSGSTLLREISGAAGARSPRDPLVLTAIAAIVVGLLFKISIVPFHMWTPDAYEGAPTAITAYLSVASKAASIALLMRLLPGTLQSASAIWIPLLSFAAVATLVVSNLAALTQNNMKRLLAYSSISHAGYILLGIVAANQLGREGGAVYLAVYGLANIGAFAVVIALGKEDVSDLGGLMRKNPWLALAMLTFLLSLAGIPPTAGFWGKYYIVMALVQAGHFAMASIAVVFMAVSTFYYFRLIRFMFLQPPFLQPTPNSEQPRALLGLRLALGATGMATLVFGIFPEPLLRFAAGAMK